MRNIVDDRSAQGHNRGPKEPGRPGQTNSQA